MIDLNVIYTKTEGFAKSGLIDSLSNIKDSKVFIFSGTKDTTVYPLVAKKGEEMYHHYGANVKTEYTLAAVHTQPTNDKTLTSCGIAGSPYISNCDYNGAFEALNHISRRAPLKQPETKKKENLFTY